MCKINMTQYPVCGLEFRRVEIEDINRGKPSHWCVRLGLTHGRRIQVVPTLPDRALRDVYGDDRAMPRGWCESRQLLRPRAARLRRGEPEGAAV